MGTYPDTAVERAMEIQEVLLLALSLGMTALQLWLEHGLYLVNVRDEVSPWLVWMEQLTDVARGWPSLFRTTTGVAAVSAAAWAAPTSACSGRGSSQPTPGPARESRGGPGCQNRAMPPKYSPFRRAWPLSSSTE